MVRVMYAGICQRCLEDNRMHAMVHAAIEQNWGVIQAHKETIRRMMAEIIADGMAAGEFDVTDADVAASCFQHALVAYCHPVIIEHRLRSGEGNESLKVVETVVLPPWGPEAELTIAGRPEARVEGEAKVTGRARYEYDVRLPGLLYARVLRSPHPHARIGRVDTSRAEALPGVRAVVSADNVPEIEWYQDSVLFDRTVRYVGDEVAGVAADTEAIAEDALRLIEVEYETLPFVVDLAAALRADAPKLRDAGPIFVAQKRGCTRPLPRSGWRSQISIPVSR